MLYPIKVIDIELKYPVTTIAGLENFMGLQGLVRLHGTPIGYINMPVDEGKVSGRAIVDKIVEKYGNVIIRCLLSNWLASPNKSATPRLEDLFNIQPGETEMKLPLVTVVVCTRDRTTDLALCLDSLCKIDYPTLDLLVVDNAPSDNSTELLIKNNFPHIRYVLEPRPGLDWARNSGITAAYGEIIAYTDDDVIVDAGWVKLLATLFLENDEVMAVTGLVVPFELETEAQVLFELYGGFGRGFEQKFHRYSNQNIPWGTLGTGQFGTGANMAYRSTIFDKIGYFDPALDVGTVTNGGGDLEMFFRVLKEGYTLVYEPGAIVRHRHRKEYDRLKTQLTNNSKGLLSYCVRSAKAYPDQRFSFLRLWIWWVQKWNIKRLLVGFLHPTSFPRELVYAELKGCFSGLSLYKKSRKNAIEIAKNYPGSMEVTGEVIKSTLTENPVKADRKEGIGICKIDLAGQLKPPGAIKEYSKVRYYFTWNNFPVGTLDISNNYEGMSTSRFVEMIVHSMEFKLLQTAFDVDERFIKTTISSLLLKRYLQKEDNEYGIQRLSNEVSVSVVVATYDRPDDLHKCLDQLTKQKTERAVEIIVVDNNAESGLTKPVVDNYPGVILVNETRKGLSYARNKGIYISKGKIILSTDDDVIVPTDWVENLVAPFKSADVMVVTGNVLPLELSTRSQQLFEQYGGLGRGFKEIKVTGEWFQLYKRGAVPTWKLGACANAAFRASIFSHPEIGMINEKLGAGTPTGCSEDTYVFYKVLKAGYSLVYEPKACVWHNHRKTMKSLHQQLYNYSKGHVAYHLETCIVDKDFRGFTRIFIEIPLNLFKRLIKSFAGRDRFPSSVILREIAGTMAGPWALFRSSRRVKRLGKSPAYTGTAE